MDKLALKKKLIEESIRKHQTVINDFRLRLKELKENEQEAIEDEPDGGHFAQKAQADAEVLQLNSELEFVNKEMEILQKLNSNHNGLSDQAELGAVVITDKNTFFISSSVEQFQVSDKTYIGLSTHSPLFGCMKGKLEGDQFSFNKINYTIKEIF